MYEKQFVDELKQLNATLRDLNFNLGALVSQQCFLLRIEAMKNGIPSEWFDPSVNGWPTPTVGSDARPEKLLVAIPYSQREKPIPK